MITLAPDARGPDWGTWDQLMASRLCAPGEAPEDMPEAWTCALMVVEGLGAPRRATGSAAALSPRPPIVRPDGTASDSLLFTSLDIALLR